LLNARFRAAASGFTYFSALTLSVGLAISWFVPIAACAHEITTLEPTTIDHSMEALAGGAEAGERLGIYFDSLDTESVLLMRSSPPFGLTDFEDKHLDLFCRQWIIWQMDEVLRLPPPSSEPVRNVTSRAATDALMRGDFVLAEKALRIYLAHMDDHFHLLSSIDRDDEFFRFLSYAYPTELYEQIIDRALLLHQRFLNDPLYGDGARNKQCRLLSHKFHARLNRASTSAEKLAVAEQLFQLRGSREVYINLRELGCFLAAAETPRLDRAAMCFQESINQALKSLKGFSDDPYFHCGLARDYFELSAVEYMRGRKEAAAENLQRCKNQLTLLATRGKAISRERFEDKLPTTADITRLATLIDAGGKTGRLAFAYDGYLSMPAKQARYYGTLLRAHQALTDDLAQKVLEDYFRDRGGGYEQHTLLWCEALLNLSRRLSDRGHLSIANKLLDALEKGVQSRRHEVIVLPFIRSERVVNTVRGIKAAEYGSIYRDLPLPAHQLQSEKIRLMGELYLAAGYFERAAIFLEESQNALERKDESGSETKLASLYQRILLNLDKAILMAQQGRDDVAFQYAENACGLAADKTLAMTLSPEEMSFNKSYQARLEKVSQVFFARLDKSGLARLVPYLERVKSLAAKKLTAGQPEGRAQELVHPIDLMVSSNLAEAYFLSGNYSKAFRQFESIKDAMGTSSYFAPVVQMAMHARAAEGCGLFSRAAELYAILPAAYQDCQLVQVSPCSPEVFYLYYLPKALVCAEEAADFPPSRKVALLKELAGFYANSGGPPQASAKKEPSRALALLNEAYKLVSPGSAEARELKKMIIAQESCLADLAADEKLRAKASQDNLSYLEEECLRLEADKSPAAAESYLNLGQARMTAGGNWQEAFENYRKGIALSSEASIRSNGASRPLLWATSMISYPVSLQFSQSPQFISAVSLLEAASQKVKHYFKANSIPATLQSAQLFELYVLTFQYKQAGAELDKFLGIDIERFDSSIAGGIESLESFCTGLLKRDPQQAKIYMERILAAKKAQLPSADRRLLPTCETLGDICLALKDSQKAAFYFKEALRISTLYQNNAYVEFELEKKIAIAEGREPVKPAEKNPAVGDTVRTSGDEAERLEFSESAAAAMKNGEFGPALREYELSKSGADGHPYSLRCDALLLQMIGAQVGLHEQGQYSADSTLLVRLVRDRIEILRRGICSNGHIVSACGLTNSYFDSCMTGVAGQLLGQYAILADALNKSGDKVGARQAVRDAQRVFDLSSDDERLLKLVAMARVELAADNKEEAIALAEQVETLPPDVLKGYLVNGYPQKLWRDLGETSRAERLDGLLGGGEKKEEGQ